MSTCSSVQTFEMSDAKEKLQDFIKEQGDLIRKLKAAKESKERVTLFISD